MLMLRDWANLFRSWLQDSGSGLALDLVSNSGLSLCLQAPDMVT